MNKLSLLGMMTLMVGATLYFLREGTKDPAGERSKIRPQVSKTQALFLGPRESHSSILSKTLSLSSSCDELSKKLDDIDFNVPIDEWIEGLNENLITNCDDLEFKAQMAKLKNVCIDQLNDNECSFHALTTRSLLRTKGIEDAEDRSLLADLVLREFARGEPDFKKLMKFSEKLMDLDPDQLSFHKLWAMSKVINALNQKQSPSELANEIEGRVHPDIWRDDQMLGLDIALKTGFEPESVETLIKDMLTQRDDARLHEILGWSLWKQNRREEARRELNLALNNNKKDTWLQEQKQRISKRNAGPNDYQARFSINFDYNDLFQ